MLALDHGSPEGDATDHPLPSAAIDVAVFDVGIEPARIGDRIGAAAATDVRCDVVVLKRLSATEDRAAPASAGGDKWFVDRPDRVMQNTREPEGTRVGNRKPEAPTLKRACVVRSFRHCPEGRRVRRGPVLVSMGGLGLSLVAGRGRGSRLARRCKCVSAYQCPRCPPNLARSDHRGVPREVRSWCTCMEIETSGSTWKRCPSASSRW